MLWNVGHPLNVALMYALFGLSLVVCGFGLYRRFCLWTAGRPDSSRLNRWNERFELLWRDVLEQRSVQADADARKFHNLIFWGFIVLTFTTTMVLIDHDLGIKIYQGLFYLVVTMLSDAFGLLLLAGVAIAAHRRYRIRPDRLHTTRTDGIVLGLLAALVIQGFLLEALRIKVTVDPWRHFSFVGNALANLFWPLSSDAARLLHAIIWWIHTLTVFALLALLPYTKFLHILASSANIFFRERSRPKGAMKYPGDLEQLLEKALEQSDGELAIGVRTIEDLTWKQRLDLDACTSCGRCQDVCPAYRSGKILSPKWLILDSRDHMLGLFADGKLVPGRELGLDALDKDLLRSMLLDHDYSTKDNPENPQRTIRASNPLVQGAALEIGRRPEAKLGGEVMDEDVFWSCTSCRACMEVCPVGIEHVDLIMDVRRSLALIDGSIPAEAQNSLRAIETRGNPFGPADSRASWADGLDVPILTGGEEVEILYWVGCVSAYDKRKQKIARSMVKILNASGARWGILGNREHCTGDPARRLGEENIFQSSAKKNLETLRSVRFRTVVANCPHCFNTLRNEYPQIGTLGDGEIRVIHHSQLIRELLDGKQLQVSPALSDKHLTYHDPCYLTRYNDVVEEPREILVQIGASRLTEMKESGKKGLCCGAGGGHFWMDMKVGERVNVLRVEQAAETQADTVATGCPFCMQMMEDGAKLTNREEQLAVRDIAELVADALA